MAIIDRSYIWFINPPPAAEWIDEKLNDAYDKGDRIENSIVDPNQIAQSQSISAGNGSQAITFRTVDEKNKQKAINIDRIKALQWQKARLKNPSLPLPFVANIKRLEVGVR